MLSNLVSGVGLWQLSDTKGPRDHCEEAKLCVCAERKDAAGVWWKTSLSRAACLLRPLSHPGLRIPPLSLHPALVCASQPCVCILPSFSVTERFSSRWGFHLEQLFQTQNNLLGSHYFHSHFIAGFKSALNWQHCCAGIAGKFLY